MSDQNIDATPEANRPSADESRLVEVDFDPFAGAAIVSVIPTTEAQREVWLADQLDPMASLAFNESITLALHGPIQVNAMQQALDALIRRHDILGAVLSEDGAELLIQESAATPLKLDDLSKMSRLEADSLLAEILAHEAANPFDLTQGPLLRARLIKLSAEESALVLCAHHVVCDGFSFAILLNDLAPLYRAALAGIEANLPLADSFADYAARLAAEQSTNSASGDEASGDEQYWLDQYRDALPPSLDLPIRQTRPASRTFASARLDMAIKSELVQQIRQLAGETKSGTFAVLLTGFAALLARLSGQTDLVIGIPSAGQSVVGSDSLVGHCVNLLPVRVAIELNQNAGENIRRVQDQIFGAFEHQSYTFGTLLKKLPIKRDAARPTLVSVMFNLDQAMDGATLDFGDVSTEILSNPRQAENFEIFLNISQAREGMTLECQYNTDLFDEDTVRLWLSGYRALLNQMTNEPEQALAILDIIGNRQALAIAQLNATDAEQPAYNNLGEWLTQSAQNDRRRPMVSIRKVGGRGLQTLSFGDIEQHSNQLARALRQRAIGRGKTVAICLPRDPRLIIAQWAVLKSGAAYVPLDPSYPAKRLAMMAQDAGIELVISDLDTVAELDLGIGDVLLLDDPNNEIANLPATPLPRTSLDANQNDPAYLIYTSGSTGRPKGVRVPHRAVANFLASMARKPGLRDTDRLLAVTTLSFDIAVLELLLPAVTGAHIILADTQTTRDGDALLSLLADSEATVMQATPSTWRLLIEAGMAEQPRLKALVGGEALPLDLAQTLLLQCRSVWNLYGPTETTVWSTVWKVNNLEAGIRIGRPIANTQIHILDERAQPCPIGVPGEIVIGGAGVALGYHHQPLLTTERFMPDTFAVEPDARLYRTGDLGRWTWTGDLEHLGRLDQQVKIRGFRIELGEIEATLQTHPSVRRAVVVTHEEQTDDVRLIAYVVSEDKRNDAQLHQQLREHLRQTLPDHMVAHQFISIDDIPLLNNGKVNRKALPNPSSIVLPRQIDTTSNATRTKTTPSQIARPASELERQILNTMAEVLNQPDLGVNDDFFAVGGHSILAARVIAKLSDTLATKIPMRSIFEASSAAKLVARINQLLADNAERASTGTQTEASNDNEAIPVIVQTDQSTGPLTVMQQRVLFVEQMAPDRVVYNVPSAHRLTGAIDLPRFTLALASVVKRQPSLRTIIASAEDKPHQKVLDSVKVALPLTDLSDVPIERREITLHRKLDSLIAVPFDLSAGPLFRGAMIRLSENEHVFFFMAHHMIWDGWSFDVLYEEMASAYALEDAQKIPAPPVSYIDFAHWQKQWLASSACRAEVSYWLDRIKNQPDPIALPADLERSGQRTGEGGTLWIDISDGMANQLRELATRTGTTLNMVMLAAYSLLISDMATDKQVLIGVPMRGRERAEFESLMGFFNNLLPLHLSPQLDLTFTDWLKHVRQEVIDIFDHQSVPFERLAAELGNTRKLDYQVLFSFQEAHNRSSQWGDLKHANVPVFQRGATEDLGLWLLDGNDGLKGGITYNTDLYHRETARTLRRRFSNLLTSIAKYPEMSIAKLLPRMHRQSKSKNETSAKTKRENPVQTPALQAKSVAVSKTGTRNKHARGITRLTESVMVAPSKPKSHLKPESTASEPMQSKGFGKVDFTPVAAFDDTSTQSTLAALANNSRSFSHGDSDTELTSETIGARTRTGVIPTAANGANGTAKTNGANHDNTDIAEATIIDPIGATPTLASEGSQNESKLAAIWARVLGMPSGDEIEPTDNFFDLGGTSLQAMQVMEEVERHSGRRGNPRLMVFGTLKQLSLSMMSGSTSHSEGDSIETSTTMQSTSNKATDSLAEHEKIPTGKGLFGRLFGSR